jgi:uncharacterized membrane protein YdjX (TVP38/TMEM64 family)
MKTRALAGAGLILLLGIAVATLPVDRWAHAALLWSARQGTTATGALAFILLYIIATVALLPESLLTLAAGAAFGIPRAMILVSIGSTLGATGAFFLGRTLAREWVGRKIERWPRFRALDRAIGKHGFWIVFLTRLSPAIPFSWLNYAYGITAVPPRQYIAASWIGMLPGTLLYVYAGSAAAHLSQVLAGCAQMGRSGEVLLWVGLGATLLVTVLVTHFARREIARELHSEADPPQ